MKILREVIINSLWMVMHVYASYFTCVWTRLFFLWEYTAWIYTKLVLLNVKPQFIWFDLFCLLIASSLNVSMAIVNLH